MQAVNVLVIVIICACGSVSEDKEVDAATSIDGQVQRCNPDSPFGTPLPIAEINTTASEEARIFHPTSW